jgi:hypothetical protein
MQHKSSIRRAFPTSRGNFIDRYVNWCNCNRNISNLILDSMVRELCALTIICCSNLLLVLHAYWGKQGIQGTLYAATYTSVWQKFQPKQMSN